MVVDQAALLGLQRQEEVLRGLPAQKVRVALEGLRQRGLHEAVGEVGRGAWHVALPAQVEGEARVL